MYCGALNSLLGVNTTCRCSYKFESLVCRGDPPTAKPNQLVHFLCVCMFVLVVIWVHGEIQSAAIFTHIEYLVCLLSRPLIYLMSACPSGHTEFSKVSFRGLLQVFGFPPSARASSGFGQILYCLLDPLSADSWGAFMLWVLLLNVLLPNGRNDAGFRYVSGLTCTYFYFFFEAYNTLPRCKIPPW